MQTTRDLKGFQQFAGVDLRRKQSFSDAPEASFNHSLRPFCDDVENLWQQTRARQSGEKVLPRETPSTGSSTGGSLRSNEFGKASAVEHNSTSGYLTPNIHGKRTLQAIEALYIGDRVPYFSLQDVHGNPCHIEIYAGQPLLLHVIVKPGNSQATLKFVRELASHNEQVKTWQGLVRFDRLCIFPGTLDAFDASGYAQLGGRWCLDPDANLLGVLQAEKHGETSAGLITYLLDPNLKLLDIIASDNIHDHLHHPIEALLNAPRELKIITAHPPVLVIPDVLDASLIQRLLDYWESGDQFEGAVGAGNKSKVRLGAKRRTDVSIVDKALIAAVDQAFAKNLFPELRKITGYDLKYRERYKLGCYFAEDGGKFDKHRDTGDVSLAFRRYAISLSLNEDYDGGELVFPEYGNYGYKPTTGSACVFPTPLLHEVQPVKTGRRFVLISFLFDEEQAAYRSCYRQHHQELDDTADYRTTVDNHFSALPTRSIYTRSIKEKWIDKQAFAFRIEEQPIEELNAPRLVDAPTGVMMIENYLSSEKCRRWRDYADDKLGSDLHVVDFDKSRSSKTMTMASKGRVTEKVPLDGINEEVNSEFVRIYASMLAKFYRVQFEWFEAPQMLRYGVGGLYNRHADSDHWLKDQRRWVRSQDQDYSVLLYLNDDFEGGELYFPRIDFRFRPRAGLLVAFPSNFHYEHAAEITTGGMRYALVSWAAIVGSQRVKEQAPYASVFLNESANKKTPTSDN